MQSKAATVQEYIDALPEERRAALAELRRVLVRNLPPGFEETMAYGMPAYVVPHTLYPQGYHCDPKQPLPFLSFASQKNYVAVYHMGIYSDAALMDWFVGEYRNRVTGKLDMGKSCVRFKNVDKIPYELLGELASRVSVQAWIDAYEKAKAR